MPRPSRRRSRAVVLEPSIADHKHPSSSTQQRLSGDDDVAVNCDQADRLLLLLLCTSSPTGRAARSYTKFHLSVHQSGRGPPALTPLVQIAWKGVGSKCTRSRDAHRLQRDGSGLRSALPSRSSDTPKSLSTRYQIFPNSNEHGKRTSHVLVCHFAVPPRALE